MQALELDLSVAGRFRPGSTQSFEDRVMLFAESDSNQATWFSAMLAAIGTASLGGIVAAVISIFKARSESRRTERSDALAEWAAIVEHNKTVMGKMTADHESLRKVVDLAQGREQRCELRCTRMEAKIGYLEAALTDRGIPFRRDAIPHKPEEEATL